MPVLGVQRGRRLKVKWLEGLAEHRDPRGGHCRALGWQDRAGHSLSTLTPRGPCLWPADTDAVDVNGAGVVSLAL